MIRLRPGELESEQNRKRIKAFIDAGMMTRSGLDVL